MKRIVCLALIATFPLVMSGCIEHRVKSDPIKVEPIKIEPIYITIDVNVRIDRQLDEFFDYEKPIEKKPEPVEPAPAPAP